MTTAQKIRRAEKINRCISQAQADQDAIERLAVEIGRKGGIYAMPRGPATGSLRTAIEAWAAESMVSV